MQARTVLALADETDNQRRSALEERIFLGELAYVGEYCVEADAVRMVHRAAPMALNSKAVNQCDIDI
ncbi:hypothetical protein [Caballeronia sp. LZ043]|uniref:hypothetical protein n=1 Tax=Caballeronia sp. LZ043 TaxID=3038569 RepID=UPI002860595A|nr:hypothetical protein [Caballeronia sp. LZ043]MDR5825990.1 hypothetical protein [Caballeronia sp. LZ043]